MKNDLKEINTKVSFMIGAEDEVSRLEIKDADANIVLFRCEFSNAQVCSMFSRMANIPADKSSINVNVQQSGRCMIQEDLIFEADDVERYNKAYLKKLIDKHVPAGWFCDYYLSSQDSFTAIQDRGRDNAYKLKVSIYQWVDKK